MVKVLVSLGLIALSLASTSANFVDGTKTVDSLDGDRGGSMVHAKPGMAVSVSGGNRPTEYSFKSCQGPDCNMHVVSVADAEEQKPIPHHEMTYKVVSPHGFDAPETKIGDNAMDADHSDKMPLEKSPSAYVDAPAEAEEEYSVDPEIRGDAEIDQAKNIRAHKRTLRTRTALLGKLESKLASLSSHADAVIGEAAEYAHEHIHAGKHVNLNKLNHAMKLKKQAIAADMAAIKSQIKSVKAADKVISLLGGEPKDLAVPLEELQTAHLESEEELATDAGKYVSENFNKNEPNPEADVVAEADDEEDTKPFRAEQEERPQEWNTKHFEAFSHTEDEAEAKKLERKLHKMNVAPRHVGATPHDHEAGIDAREDAREVLEHHHRNAKTVPEAGLGEDMEDDCEDDEE